MIVLYTDDNAVYTGCVRSFKSASYDILSLIMLDSSVLHCYDISTQTHLKMLQPYRISWRYVILYYIRKAVLV
jgi:hypothetical protein